MKLRGWLTRGQRPLKLRLKMADGDERIVELRKGAKRLPWEEILSTIASSGAVSIEKLGVNDAILAGRALDEDDEEDFDVGKEDKTTLGKAIRDQAAMLDRYGARLNESFAMGAKAASASSDKLVELVEVLTNHLAIAITNVNNLSVNLSNALQATGSGPDGEESQSTKMLQGVMAMITASAGARPAPESNGKPKKP